jgi:molybdenum-dependent DNA-binding transcriptional regulator ModE
MIYCFDLDETLCKKVVQSEAEGIDYEDAEPIWERIDRVNKLYDEGHTILIDSARGSKTGCGSWTTKTGIQLEKWGLKYHSLRCGQKFAADIYIDDKGMNSEEYF